MTKRSPTRYDMVCFLYGIGVGHEPMSEMTDAEIADAYQRARENPLIQALTRDFPEPTGDK